MIEESLSSIWASMHSWFIPAVLFVLINIVIGSIAFYPSQNAPDDPHKPLSRTSSVLHRLRSFSLYRQSTLDLPALTATLYPAFGEDPLAYPDPPAEEEPEIEDAAQIERRKSEGRNRPKEEKLPERMKKSASAKLAFEHCGAEEVADALRRPATVRERTAASAAEEEVDVRADEFINRFRQQLKLQRLDSIIRYKELFNR